MQRRFLLSSFGLVLLILVGCGGPSMPAQRPADFTVEYFWQEGSLPPPYHYAYSITINGDGQGEVVMIPDYPADDVPEWRESFQVDAAELDRLYQHFRDQGLFSRSWTDESEMRVGGSSEWMTVMAGGTEVKIPSQLVSRQAAIARDFYAVVKALVPSDQWVKLEAQRKEYQEAHQP